MISDGFRVDCAPPAESPTITRTVFQSLAWARVLAELSGSGSWRAVDIGPDEQPAAPWYLVECRWRGMFRSLEAMPGYLYGPPSGNPDGTSIEIDLPAGLLRGRTVSLTYVEHPLLPKVMIRPSAGVVLCSQTASTEILPLSGTEEEMWKSLSHDHRNMIRRARKEGVTVRPGSQKGDTDRFYQLYEPATASWGYAGPPYSRSFFEKLLWQSPDLGARLVLAEREGRTIAGAVVIDDIPSPLYWFGALDKGSAKYFPTYLLIWEEIRRAISKGYRWFNFGASGNLQGVRQFKLSWGAKTTEYRIFTIRQEPLCKVIEAIVDPIAKTRHSINNLVRKAASGLSK